MLIELGTLLLIASVKNQVGKAARGVAEAFDAPEIVKDGVEALARYAAGAWLTDDDND